MRSRTARPNSARKTVRDIRKTTRRQYSAEQKVRIVLDGPRNQSSIAELYREEGIAQSMFYDWPKDFLEAGKRWLTGGAVREGTSYQIKTLRAGARQLKEAPAGAT